MFSHDWSMLGPSSTLVCAPMLAGAARSQNAGLADASLFSVCLLLCRPDASDTMRRARSGSPVHIWPSLDEDVGRGHGCCTHLAVSRGTRIVASQRRSAPDRSRNGASAHCGRG